MPNLIFWGKWSKYIILCTSCFILTPIHVGFGPLANLHTDNDTYYFHYYLFKLFPHSNPVALSTNYYFELAHESIKTSTPDNSCRNCPKFPLTTCHDDFLSNGQLNARQAAMLNVRKHQNCLISNVRNIRSVIFPDPYSTNDNQREFMKVQFFCKRAMRL